ncbi:DUF4348 domain-containing protein [Aquimarina sp. MMG016]|uniref:DUF4348 domain-containing protein n=1 Tax=Aquimarina sp. MMG016 TaxID=2822690 RepID=UPI001B3A175A|nr:DUF4348 domain-containing protein [Aquimarina sp. MMG016]MBQ4821909.1 DUF4348 domain-containing protein [Aquimarina sp. MMG016]
MAKKHQNTRVLIFLIIPISIIFLVSMFFYNSAIGFGKAITNGTIEISKILKEDHKENSTIKPKIVQLKPYHCDMDFKSFFTKFSSDSIFQIRRIKFPLKNISYDIYGEDQTTPIEDFTAPESFSFMDFSVDHKAMDKEVDAYKVEIEKKKDDFYVYHIIGIDNGIMVDFGFKKENGCWLLIYIEDFST